MFNEEMWLEIIDQNNKKGYNNPLVPEHAPHNRPTFKEIDEYHKKKESDEPQKKKEKTKTNPLVPK